MPQRKISAARTELLTMDTGVNRRLFYPAAGDDVGCSLGLFWHVCDAFYLIDPEYGKQISYDSVINALPGGARYMEGMRVEVGSPETGYWAGSQYGRRYPVWLKGQPGVKKRLCFAACGTKEWLASTNTNYNAIVLKDYAGIIGGDEEFPYADAWGRLNHKGVFAETIGRGRASWASGFARYRYRGFSPLFEVRSDGDAQIGFGEGLQVFQKSDASNEGEYRARERRLDALGRTLQDLMGVFPIMCDYSPVAIQDEPEYAGLHALMTEGSVRTWSALAASDSFLSWVRSRLSEGHQGVSNDLIRDLLAPLDLANWGGW